MIEELTPAFYLLAFVFPKDDNNKLFCLTVPNE